MLPAAAALLALAFGALILLSWWRARAVLRKIYSAPPACRWTASTSAPEAPSDPEEWRRCGYERAGVLSCGTPAPLTLTVFIHSSLPIYALECRGAADRKAAWWTVLLTFYADGALIATSSSSRPVGHLTAVDLGVPRLVQLREGGTPLALDGQHSGTVRAWAVGGREALPATRDALLDYLQADLTRLRPALERAGWLSPATHLRTLAGRPARVLRF